FDTVDFLVNTADESEIRGILAGQDLVRSGWAMVVDLEHDELRYEPEEFALERLGGRDSLTKLEYRSCEFDNRRIIPVTINGVRSSLMIDTGASRTSLTRNNEAIPTMRSMIGKREANTGVMSSGHELLVNGVAIDFAKTSFVVSASVLPGAAYCGRGLLGADVLDSCVMVWGSKSLWVSCRAPARRD